MLAKLLIAAVFAANASAVSAAEYRPLLGKKLDLGCHNGNCDSSVLSKVQLVGTAPDGGTEYAVVSNDSNTNGERSIGISFVLCSTQRPAVYYPQEDKWSVSYLHPNESSDVNDATLASYVMYFAACHDTYLKKPSQLDHLVRTYGYKVAGHDGPDSVDTPFIAIR